MNLPRRRGGRLRGYAPRAGGVRLRRAGAALALLTTLVVGGVGCGSPVGDDGPGGTSAAVAAPAGSPGAASESGDAAIRGPAADSGRTPPYPELLPRTTGDAPLVIALGQLSPAVATNQTLVTVDATVTNRGTTTLRPTVRSLLGAPLISRRDLDAPASTEHTTAVGDPVTLGDLAPGASAAVHLTIPPEQLRLTGSYGVLPLLVQAQLADTSAVLETYLPYEIRKEYEPLSLSLSVPLTADPDPELASQDAATAEKAWARTTGAGSRLDRILTGTNAGAVTYALDPSLLGPAPARAGTPSTTSTTSTTSATQPPSRTTSPSAPKPPGPSSSPSPSNPSAPASPARDALTSRLAALAPSHPLWALPREDPDVAQLLRDDIGAAMLADLVQPDPRIQDRLAPGSLTRVAWPATSLTTGEWRRLATAYGPDWTGPLVLPLSAAADPATTGDAARRYPDGPAVLAYDDQLSRLLADAAGAPEGTSAGLTQRFLAETMTILQEYPGRARQLLIVAPRSFDPDPTTLAALLRTADSTPWLRSASTEAISTRSRSEAAATAVAPQDRDGTKDPFGTTGSPLDADRIDAVAADLHRLDGIGSILPTTTTVPAATSSALLGLLATRWRGHAPAWQAAQAAAVMGVDGLLHGVAVTDSQINFFADSGTMQVTVVNGLNVDVHDVQLHLLPQGRSPRLRLPSTPYVLSIAAHSRATVKVPVEAIAAGPTVVSAQVSTPDGTRLGAQDATLTVQVQPTTGWVVLGIGGVAAVVFLVGLFRTIRRNRPRVTAEDLKEIDLE